MKKIVFCILLLTLTSCASSTGNLTPEMEAEMRKPLICNGDEQCQLYWERALFYVNSHSRYKIQTQTDSLIQTYSPTGGTTNLGYNISKEPLGNNSYRIWIKVGCDNMFGCYPKRYEEVLRFKRYVSKQ